ncbi:MAG: hypothetical protein K9L98_00165 [Candidatus Pacebacteria bacterium]|nr:hypothetical protein [Candidatus Paceibacterota bacterium]MCF7862418.1 hypothetical protein [Candidatus Paceibacterota bacterium]
MSEDVKKIVLFDAHAVIHRAYHALPDFLSSKGEPTGALYGLSNMIIKIISDLKPDYLAACYDLPQKTFRHEVYKEYKAGRVKTDPALIEQLKSSRKIFEAFNIPIYDSPGFEADDILGTIVEKISKDNNTGKEEKTKISKNKKEKIQVIVASGDMDTMQLVDGDDVEVYTLKKGIHDTILYNEQKVLERFGFLPKFLPDYKGLRGDPSDNIIGIKGIGEKTATELIQIFGHIEDVYKAIEEKEAEKNFKEKGFSERIFNLLKNGEEEALFSKTLATIRRDAPIDFALPQKTFWQAVEKEKIESVCREFEFRSLGSRLKGFLEQENKKEDFDNKGDKKNTTLLKNNTSKTEEKIEHSQISPRELKETSIALWLLNSEIANPTLEDILLFTNTKDFTEAKKIIFKKLKEEDLERVYREIEEPIIEEVESMTTNGILIDKKFFKDLAKEYHTELDKIIKDIYNFAGEEFNINSPKQLGEILFNKLQLKSKKKSAGGSLSTNISVLEELEDKHPIIKKIMEHRELSKLLSTYIDVIPEMADEEGRLHAEFIQNGASTGRFSSKDPNMQNLPIKTDLGKKIRYGFVAQKGYKLVAFDYSQVELRVAAMLSGDKKMTQIFAEGKDIHAGVASFVFGVSEKSVTSEMRRQAKVINFGIIYGMGVSALRKNLGGERADAQKFYDNYFEQFEGLHKYLEEVKEFASQHKYTVTLFGRKRMFPNINSRIPFLKAMAVRTAINAPIQGTATADIIKLAIRYVREDLKKAGLSEKVKLILQIHDELVYEIQEEVTKEAQIVIKKAMENLLQKSFLQYKTEIPLVVNFGAGDNLGELK